MRVVLQRVSEASVTIDGQLVNEIQQGYLLLVGIVDGDTAETVEKMAAKVHDLRIFEDENGKMNLSIEQIGGQVLSISQFTLYANCKKGRRRSGSSAGDRQSVVRRVQRRAAKDRPGRQAGHFRSRDESPAAQRWAGDVNSGQPRIILSAGGLKAA